MGGTDGQGADGSAGLRYIDADTDRFGGKTIAGKTGADLVKGGHWKGSFLGDCVRGRGEEGEQVS